MAEEFIVDVDDNGIEEILKREEVVLLDCFAQWCNPCRTLAPILHDVAAQLQGRVKFAKLDIDKNQAAAKTYGVTSVPTLILFKRGKEVNRLVGLRDVAAIQEFALS